MEGVCSCKWSFSVKNSVEVESSRFVYEIIGQGNVVPFAGLQYGTAPKLVSRNARQTSMVKVG